MDGSISTFSPMPVLVRVNRTELFQLPGNCMRLQCAKTWWSMQALCA